MHHTVAPHRAATVAVAPHPLPAPEMKFIYVVAVIYTFLRDVVKLQVKFRTEFAVDPFELGRLVAFIAGAPSFA